MANRAPNVYFYQNNMFAAKDLSHGRHKPLLELGSWDLRQSGDLFQDLVTKTIDSHIKFRRHM